jgi:hypothetical protein
MEINEPIEMDRPKRNKAIVYEYKTIDNPYSRDFDIDVNEAIRQGWELEKRFINRRNVYIAFMRRKIDGVYKV